MSRTVHLIALTSAVLNAGATICIRQGLRGSNPYTGFWISVVVGTVGLWAAVLLTGGPGQVSGRSALLFMLAGLIGTVGGRLLRFLAIEKVGASIGAALNNVHPLVSAVLAILLLGERVTMPILAGTLAIVVGTILLSSGGRTIGFQPWYLALPLLSATCFGAVAILRKLGLAGASPLTGTAINATTALIAYTAFLVAAGYKDALRCRGRSLAYFVGAGLTENTGVFLNVVALGAGAVSVVAPLTGAAPIFVLLLTFFFLRGVETLTLRVIVGTLMTVLGVMIVTALS